MSRLCNDSLATSMSFLRPRLWKRPTVQVKIATDSTRTCYVAFSSRRMPPQYQVKSRIMFLPNSTRDSTLNWLTIKVCNFTFFSCYPMSNALHSFWSVFEVWLCFLEKLRSIQIVDKERRENAFECHRNHLELKHCSCWDLNVKNEECSVACTYSLTVSSTFDFHSEDLYAPMYKQSSHCKIPYWSLYK